MKKSYLIFIIFINILFMIIFREDYAFYILPTTISLFLLLKLIISLSYTTKVRRISVPYK